MTFKQNTVAQYQLRIQLRPADADDTQQYKLLPTWLTAAMMPVLPPVLHRCAAKPTVN